MADAASGEKLLPRKLSLARAQKPLGGSQPPSSALCISVAFMMLWEQLSSEEAVESLGCRVWPEQLGQTQWMFGDGRQSS